MASDMLTLLILAYPAWGVELVLKDYPSAMECGQAIPEAASVWLRPRSEWIIQCEEIETVIGRSIIPPLRKVHLSANQ